MSKLLRFTFFIFLGIMSFLLITACSFSRSDSSRSSLSLTSDCHIVQHSMGETCVPKHPQHLVTIFHGILGNALSFGIKPIASSIVFPDDPFPGYLKAQTEGIETIGLQNTPNLEKILIQKPDLILVWRNIQAIYPLLSKIAPTVVIPWNGPSAWREQIDAVAKALGTEKEADQLWKHYYQRVNQLKVALSDRYQDKEISIFDFSSQWGFWIMAKNSFCGSIVHDVGLNRPKVQDVETESGYINFTSAEQLDMIDGDIMLVAVRSEVDKKAFEKFITNPLGRKLKALQQKQIFFVNDYLAWNGATFIAADVVLDDLENTSLTHLWRVSRELDVACDDLVNTQPIGGRELAVTCVVMISQNTKYFVNTQSIGVVVI